MLSETLSRDQIICTKNRNDKCMDSIITDYLYHLFGLKITYALTYLTCIQNNTPNLLEYKNLILSFYLLSLENKHLTIHHDKFTYLSKICITMNNLFDIVSKQ